MRVLVEIRQGGREAKSRRLDARRGGIIHLGSSSRGGSNVVRVADPRVSHRHARIHLSRDAGWIEDESKNGTFVLTAAACPPSSVIQSLDALARHHPQAILRDRRVAESPHAALWAWHPGGEALGRGTLLRLGGFRDAEFVWRRRVRFTGDHVILLVGRTVVQLSILDYGRDQDATPTNARTRPSGGGPPVGRAFAREWCTSELDLEVLRHEGWTEISPALKMGLSAAPFFPDCESREHCCEVSAAELQSALADQDCWFGVDGYAWAGFFAALPDEDYPSRLGLARRSAGMLQLLVTPPLPADPAGCSADQWRKAFGASPSLADAILALAHDRKRGANVHWLLRLLHRGTHGTRYLRLAAALVAYSQRDDQRPLWQRDRVNRRIVAGTARRALVAVAEPPGVKLESSARQRRLIAAAEYLDELSERLGVKSSAELGRLIRLLRNGHYKELRGELSGPARGA
jgi:hypothetical protein